MVLAKIPIGNPEVQKEIGQLVKANKVVVFMKGNKEQPQCGFSNAVVQILRMHGVDNYNTIDVLQNQDIRQGVKDFTQWPTVPQVFLNGEFIGGCDIMIQMHRSGELVETLKKAGIESKIPDPPVDEKSDAKTEPASPG
ncbi:putative Glutaredoxin-related protein 5, mitochondrial [Hypsibius exemplaris]|uniref:Glutaredoxin-related protein 5, mitochondrial n=1 Tax=Hypsibius exemplaris TaxID=2072580 RepID=A0A1W0X8U6_HYPEX|nr:putative Glutaredoxin-related protein 5, mitochondrial [Hypsibius exemplaris]